MSYGDTIKQGDTDAAILAGTALAEPTTTRHAPVVDGLAKVDERQVTVLSHVLPSTEGTAKLEHTLIDFEAVMEQPSRKRGTVKVADLASFLAYVDEHGDDRTTIWVAPDGRKMIAVLDDHAADDGEGNHGANWGTHRVEYDLLLSPEWEFWKRLDGDLVAQEVFAEHVEDGATEIVKPDAATMLEIATYFQATRGGSFKSAKVLQSGAVQLTNDVDVAAKAGVSGEIEVPQEIELAIAPYVGGQAYKVRAHFRYRVPPAGGELKLGYKLVRPADVLRDARDQLAAQVREKHDRTYLGTPRSPESLAIVS